MGSCYSCRSNGGLPTYTTVAMATTATDLDSSSSVAGRGKGRPSSLRGGGSFGFRKRTPVSVKSQSKDRTSELVHLYETKISNLCNTNNSRHSTPSSSPIILGSKDRGLNGCSLSSVTATEPTFKSSSVTNMSSHFGFGAGTGSMTGGRNNNFGYAGGGCGTGGNRVSDANCNDIVNDERCIKLGALSNRERFFLSGTLNMTSPTKYDCDFNGRENKLVGVPGGHSSPKSSARSEDVQNGNIAGEKGEEFSSSVVAVANNIPSEPVNKLESNTQLPYMVKTQISGLPRPQIPVIVDKKVSKVIEAMQISADEIGGGAGDDDNHVFEADSGLGNSLSERKNEGDTETLAEVEQIEGDTASISSKGNRRESPEKEKIIEPPETENFGINQSEQQQHLKATKPSGIARFRYTPTAATNTVSVPTKIIVPQQQQTQKVYLPDKKFILVDKVPKETNPMQTQAKLAARKIPLAVQLSNKVQPSGMKPLVKKGFEARKSSKSGMYATNGKKGGENEFAELRQKENITPEVVEVVPLNLPYTAKSDNVAKISCVYKSPRIESVLPSTIIETIEKKRNSMAANVEDSGVDFSHHHHHQELGPYSPPSEKDFFLIDDEIADQPALIACQQLPLSSYDLRESMCRSSSKLATVYSDMNEEGGLPALAHVQSSPVIRSPCLRRRTSHSVDTLSPCSSIDSDDLMLDFERLDESCQSRPLSEVFGDGFQLMSTDGKSKEQYLFAKLTAGLMKTPTSAASTTTAAGCDSGSRRSSLSQKTNWILGNSSSGKVVSESGVTHNQHMLPTTESGPANNSPASVYVATNGRRVSDDTDATLDVATYRLLTQDITNVKTLLLRLKRVLQEADTVNPLNSSVVKNGLIPHQNSGETSGAKLSDERNLVIVLEQENADLRRQVVFLQQQLEERDRSIRLLKQQQKQVQQIQTSMGGVEMVANDKKDVAVSNAACQTERQRSALNSFLTSVNDESSFGSTVSFRIGKF